MNEEPKDLSSRAISLARHIDRLPPGEFSMKLNKRRDAWDLWLCGEEYGLAQLVIADSAKRSVGKEEHGEG